MPAVAFSAHLSIDSATLPPAGSAVITVAYDSESSQASGFQFDLNYDSSVMSVSVIPGDALRSASKTLYTADLSPNLRRLLMTGENQTVVPSGTLLTFVLSVRPGAASAAYPFSFTGTELAGPDGEAVYAQQVPAVITVDANAGT